MASFNILNAAAYGYRQTWRQHSYLLRLAIVPLLLKFICLLFILRLDWGQRFLAQALILLPAYLADGWMQSCYAQRLLLGHKRNNHGIIAGALTYALTRFLFASLIYIAYLIDEPYLQGSLNLTAQTASMSSPIMMMRGLAALLLLVAGVWIFRFLWFYIAMAVRYSWRACERDLRGWQTSFCFGGAAIFCFLPSVIISAFIASMLASTLITSSNHIPWSAQFILVTTRAILDTLTATISTAAMAHGLQAMIAKRQQQKQLL